MADAGVFQVQFALDAAAGFVVDFAAVIEVGDAAAFGIQELQLQRRGGVGDIAMRHIAAGGDEIGAAVFIAPPERLAPYPAPTTAPSSVSSRASAASMLASRALISRRLSRVGFLLAVFGDAQAAR